jgi:uncharacterized Zn-binding protein involved in type VI secretion
MSNVCRQGDAASCGHTSSGSSNVFVNGKGCSRNLQDSAGGIILGPGSKYTYVNGTKMTLLGDNVAGHGDPPHSAPVMVQSSNNVCAT